MMESSSAGWNLNGGMPTSVSAGGHDPPDVVVGGNPPELAAPQVDAGDLIAHLPVALLALRGIEPRAGLDFRRRCIDGLALARWQAAAATTAARRPRNDARLHESREVSASANLYPNRRQVQSENSYYADVDFSINVDIAAAPDRVWAVMSDIEKWHEWTPSVKSVARRDQGPLRPGSQAWIRQPKFPPALWTVTEVADRSFTWVSRAPGMLVTARHYVTPVGDGSRADAVVELRRSPRAVLRPADARHQQPLSRDGSRRPQAPQRRKSDVVRAFRPAVERPALAGPSTGQRCKHVRPGPDFLRLEHLALDLRAGGDQVPDNLVVPAARFLGRRLQPAVQRPSERRRPILPVLGVDVSPSLNQPPHEPRQTHGGRPVKRRLVEQPADADGRARVDEPQPDVLGAKTGRSHQRRLALAGLMEVDLRSGGEQRVDKWQSLRLVEDPLENRIADVVERVGRDAIVPAPADGGIGPGTIGRQQFAQAVRVAIVDRLLDVSRDRRHAVEC